MLREKRDDEFKTSSMCLPSPYLCVEVKRTEKAVHVRDSKTGAILDFDHNEWKAFVGGVKRDEFDV